MDRKQLELKRDKIQKEIDKIDLVREMKRVEEMKLLVGCCIKSNYDFSFRKILDFIINKKFGIYFIMEEIKINNQGESSIKITSDYPYTNKEWNNHKIPICGWIEEISEQEYTKKKAKVLKEMGSPVKLKKFLIKEK